jgi:methylmalonyl-CoA mutase cobalamin-binding domain/chain
MTDLSAEFKALAAYRPTHKVRFVTAASLFDGHDAAINIMRRIQQGMGCEVVHLGHNRSVDEVVTAALQEDVQGIAISSYQGGHVEYFKYMVDLLKARGAHDIRFLCLLAAPEGAAPMEIPVDEAQESPGGILIVRGSGQNFGHVGGAVQGSEVRTSQRNPHYLILRVGPLAYERGFREGQVWTHDAHYNRNSLLLVGGEEYAVEPCEAFQVRIDLEAGVLPSIEEDPN